GRVLHAGDETGERLEVGAQEGGGALVGHLAVLGAQAGRDLDEALRLTHGHGVEVAEDGAQVLLGGSRGDRATGGADDGGGLAAEGHLAVRAGRPVEGVLEHTRDRAAVLGGDDDDAVDVGDRLLEVESDLRELCVVVGRVEREVLDRDLDERDALRSEVLQRRGEEAVDRGARDAADDVADGTGHGVPSESCSTCWGASILNGSRSSTYMRAHIIPLCRKPFGSSRRRSPAIRPPGDVLAGTGS